jgi:glycosyltransferase involved in cell wall biosynthesis
MSSATPPTGRRVLMACANYWNSPVQVGDQHLARRFAEAGWDVAYVSAPISPLHWLARTPDLAPRCANWRTGGRRDLNGRLFHYVPASAVVPRDLPMLRSAWLLRNWPRLTIPNVRRVLARSGFADPHLIYLRDPRQAYWLEALPHRASIYRVADRDAGFRDSSPHLAAVERRIAAHVDLVLYTAPNLREYVERMKPRQMRYFPNGVDFERFSRPMDRPPDIARLSRPIAIYVGSIDFWFDSDLLDAAAAALLDVDFVIIGPRRRGCRPPTPRPNLHLLGPRPYAQVPAYLQAARVGLIPFDVARHAVLVDAINPIKLHEYFACGLPCVATAWQALRELRTPAILTQTHEQFIAAIRATVAQPPSRQPLLDFARANDWSARFAELQERLRPLLER